eukprot:1630493-Amphidinium_carterae.1
MPVADVPLKNALVRRQVATFLLLHHLTYAGPHEPRLLPLHPLRQLLAKRSRSSWAKPDGMQRKCTMTYKHGMPKLVNSRTSTKIAES